MPSIFEGGLSPRERFFRRSKLLLLVHYKRENIFSDILCLSAPIASVVGIKERSNDGFLGAFGVLLALPIHCRVLM